jgi:hypothetical protein
MRLCCLRRRAPAAAAWRQGLRGRKRAAARSGGLGAALGAERAALWRESRPGGGARRLGAVRAARARSPHRLRTGVSPGLTCRGRPRPCRPARRTRRRSGQGALARGGRAIGLRGAARRRDPRPHPDPIAQPLPPPHPSPPPLPAGGAAPPHSPTPSLPARTGAPPLCAGAGGGGAPRALPRRVWGARARAPRGARREGGRAAPRAPALFMPRARREVRTLNAHFPTLRTSQTPLRASADVSKAGGSVRSRRGDTSPPLAAIRSRNPSLAARPAGEPRASRLHARAGRAGWRAASPAAGAPGRGRAVPDAAPAHGEAPAGAAGAREGRLGPRATNAAHRSGGRAAARRRPPRGARAPAAAAAPPAAPRRRRRPALGARGAARPWAAPPGAARPPLRRPTARPPYAPTPPRPPQVCAAALGLEDPYRTLGVRANADEKEIKAAYRKLALKCVPLGGGVWGRAARREPRGGGQAGRGRPRRPARPKHSVPASPHPPAPPTHPKQHPTGTTRMSASRTTPSAALCRSSTPMRC